MDYLQLMSSAGGKSYAGENRQQAVSDISRMLKIMAKELNVPVICLSQLSRANEKREDKRPMPKPGGPNRQPSSSNRVSKVLKVTYSGAQRRGTFPVSPWRFLATMQG